MKQLRTTTALAAVFAVFGAAEAQSAQATSEDVSITLTVGQQLHIELDNTAIAFVSEVDNDELPVERAGNNSVVLDGDGTTTVWYAANTPYEITISGPDGETNFAAAANGHDKPLSDLTVKKAGAEFQALGQIHSGSAPTDMTSFDVDYQIELFWLDRDDEYNTTLTFTIASDS